MTRFWAKKQTKEIAAILLTKFLFSSLSYASMRLDDEIPHIVLCFLGASFYYLNYILV
jgi:hypothetical protein